MHKTVNTFLCRYKCCRFQPPVVPLEKVPEATQITIMPMWGYIRFYRGRAKGWKVWQGSRKIPPKRRSRDISSVPAVGKRFGIAAGQGTAALNFI
jgi:hypothetical protein